MNEALQAVLDYVQTPQTDYAILITGPWGCGKTYFWKNVIEPELTSLQSSKHIQRILYVSLYGVSDAKDIDRSLFAQSYPGINRKSVGRVSRFVAGVIEALGYADLAKVNLRSLVKAKDAVICFDDLERIRLPMKEALGYINTFVEHEGAKAVILCNEDEINKNDDKELYKKMKEKVVGASLTFRPDLDTVFKTIINEHKARPAFHGFMLQNATLMRHLFDRSETYNIRSLRRAMAAIAIIFDVLKSSNINPNVLAKQLIYAVAPASFELHGRGADPAELRNIHAREYMAVAGISASMGRPEKSGEKTYEARFAERYFHDFGMLDLMSVTGCPPICEFLLTGALDRSALVSWAEELIKTPDEREERIKRITSGPREMEDEDFERTAARVLKEVEAGEIAAIGKYVHLYD